MKDKLIFMGDASYACGAIAALLSCWDGSQLSRHQKWKGDYYLVKQRLLEKYLTHILEESCDDYQQIVFIDLKKTKSINALLDNYSFKKDPLWIQPVKQSKNGLDEHAPNMIHLAGDDYSLMSETDVNAFISEENRLFIQETFGNMVLNPVLLSYPTLIDTAKTIYDNTGESRFFYWIIQGLASGQSPLGLSQKLEPYAFGQEDEFINVHGATLLDEAIRYSSRIESVFEDSEGDHFQDIRTIVKDILVKMWDPKHRRWRKKCKGYRHELFPEHKEAIDFQFDDYSKADKPWSPTDFTLLQSRLIGISYGLEKIRHQMDSINGSPSVIILGDCGTGKENIARWIHYKEHNDFSNFISYDCANVDEVQMKDDLLGHVKGAHTGAESDSVGLLEQANGGTLFLDEIGDIPLRIQGLLLRFLNDGNFYPQGSREMKSVSVRIIAATNRDIASLVRQGKFRPELYFRLAEFVINVPRLKERKEDIGLIANCYLRMYMWSDIRDACDLEQDEVSALEQYDYPGNVRELISIIKRAYFTDDYNFAKLIAEEKANTASFFNNGETIKTPQPVNKTLDAVKKEYIQKVLRANNGKKMKAASVLGVSFATLQKALEEMEQE